MDCGCGQVEYESDDEGEEVDAKDILQEQQVGVGIRLFNMCSAMLSSAERKLEHIEQLHSSYCTFHSPTW